MCYRGGRGIVPPAGIRLGQMIAKFLHRLPQNEKRGKIRLFFTPFVRYSAAECSLIPVIVIASRVCRLFTNDYFCRLV